MGQGDEVRVNLVPEAPQVFVAQPPRRRFQTFVARLRLSGHVEAGAEERYVQLRAQPLAKCGVVGALGAYAVVDVGGV